MGELRVDETSAQIFREVAKHHSLRTASKTLYMSEPAVGAKMRSLEEDLGITLFERSSRGIALTAEGTVFLELMERFLHLCEDIRQSMHVTVSDEPCAHFHIGATPALSSYRLAPVLDRVSRFSNRPLTVTACSQDEVIFGVLSRKFHAGMVSSPNGSKTLRIVELFTDPLCMVTARATQNVVPTLPVNRINTLRILCPGPPFQTWNVLQSFFQRHHVWPRHITFVNNRETIKKALVDSANWYGFVPLSSLDSDREIWNWLQPVALEPEEGLSVSEYLIWREGHLSDYQSQMIERLIAFLADSAKCSSHANLS